MINSKLKNKIDAIWKDFCNENMAQKYDMVNQLTILMFIKMLDDKQIALENEANSNNTKLNQEDLTFKEGNYVNNELGINVPYSNLRWSNFKNQESLDLSNTIKNLVIPFIKDNKNNLIGEFSTYANKFTYGFDNKERLLKSVVEKLSDPEMDCSNIDLMGDVYEYLCGTGITGQYRTPRHLINMAVEMMKPKNGEKILDPAMGTAGFLIESAKYITNNENTNTLSNDMFYGCDSDTNMARIGYMNCILHNITNPTITMDSLLENKNADNYQNKFDLILTNPPYAGTLVEDEINKNLLKINNTKRTELLFLSLMINSLKVGGRCMTIVPDGVLFGNDAVHKRLRVELIDKQKLIAVISMPNGIFQKSTTKESLSRGSSVKTAFLVFEKTNKGGTDKVWFYDMKNDGYSLDAKRVPIKDNDIPDIVNRFNNLSNEKSRTRKDNSFLVDVMEIKSNDYDLSINRYKEVEYDNNQNRQCKIIFNEIKTLEKEITRLTNQIGGKLDE